jgi:predicted ATPase
MFKLLYIKLESHPQLKNIEISFVDESESLAHIEPYTSIIIGPNGTGKSLILRTIVEIFRQFARKDIEADDVKINYGFHLRYLMGKSVYEIVSRRLATAERKGLRKNYLAFKDRPFDQPFYEMQGKLPIEKLPGYEINFADLQLPVKLLASAIFLNDRFPFQNSQESDFYQYLGVRRTASATSTGTFTRKTINYLFYAAKAEDFRVRMENMFSFLEFEPHLVIKYQTRYNHLFFSGELTEEKLTQFYERWWEVDGVNRKKNNAPWGQWYYNQLKKDHPGRLTKLIKFMNEAAGDSMRIQHKPKSKARNFIVDFFNPYYDPNFFSYIQELEKLSILVLDEIKMRKYNSEVGMSQLSSGEYHLILGLLGIFANIDNDNLVLIDEPEISLHPNWQLQYVTLLKKMFAAYHDCHFIISTHSHFLVADLEGKSSSIISLNRNEKGVTATLLDGVDPYGWSAEEILYNIFKVKTVRNFFLEADLTDLLGLISNNSKNKQLIESKLKNIKTLSISANDPLNAVIEEADAYIDEL